MDWQREASGSVIDRVESSQALKSHQIGFKSHFQFGNTKLVSEFT